MRLTRVTLFFVLLILGLGFYRLIDFLLKDLEFQTLQATEESMVDTANLLANYLENEGDLDRLFRGSKQREIEARIFHITKTGIGMNAYVTDEKGIIIYDSLHPENVGQDSSIWQDVRKTLNGEYGARSSRTDEKNPNSSVMFVGAPIHTEGKITGCVSVSKAQSDVLPFVHERRRTIIQATGLIGLGILVLIVAVFIWLFRPVGQLTEYARAITRGERRPKPKVGLGREVNTLANALHDMRESLEGRQYADQYIQTLTHELKSPLAAIKGAAELLNEEMSSVDRSRFLGNIHSQTARCERLIHRLLELSALEAQTHLKDTRTFDLVTRCQHSLDQLRPLAEAKQITLSGDLPASLDFTGNEPLLGSALNHLLENAIQFSPNGGPVTLSLKYDDSRIAISVTDHGSGIPDFASTRAFERFYSYRPEDHPTLHGTKGNGLGLSFVREVAKLHQGTATIGANQSSGTTATITLPFDGMP